MKNMSNKLYEESSIQAIANAIRSKNGSSDTYTVSQMSTAIDNIPSGGSIPAYPLNNGKNNIWVVIDTPNQSVEITVETNGDSVNWGDGTTNTNTTHTYSDVGIYCITANSLASVTDNIVLYAEYNNNVTLPSYQNLTIKKAALNNSSLTDISASQFRTSALKEISMPYVTTIGAYAFNNCISLTSIDLSGVTTIGDYAFYFCQSLNNLVIPSSVTTIGKEAFSGSTASGALSITSLTLPSTITSIGQQAFGHNKFLTTVVINCNIPTNINSVFRGCTALQTVTVGANVTALGNTTFMSVNSTYVIHLQGTTPPSLGGLSSTPAAIYVPAESVDTYKAASGWSTYASVIQAEPVGE
jgi:hypothetical protein